MTREYLFFVASFIMAIGLNAGGIHLSTNESHLHAKYLAQNGKIPEPNSEEWDKMKLFFHPDVSEIPEREPGEVPGEGVMLVQIPEKLGWFLELDSGDPTGRTFGIFRHDQEKKEKIGGCFYGCRTYNFYGCSWFIQKFRTSSEGSLHNEDKPTTEIALPSNEKLKASSIEIEPTDYLPKRKDISSLEKILPPSKKIEKIIIKAHPSRVIPSPGSPRLYARPHTKRRVVN